MFDNMTATKADHPKQLPQQKETTMAHELDTRDNGVHSFVSLLKTAWHNLGTVVGDYLSIDEAMDLGGQNIPYALVPTYFQARGGALDGEYLPSGHASIIRTDRNISLGDCSPTYSLGNARAEMYGPVFEALLDAGLLRLETAGAIKDGRILWALYQVATPTDEAELMFKDADRIAQYIRVRSAFDGKSSNRVDMTPVRVECANLDAAANYSSSNVFKISHRGDVTTKTQDAATAVYNAAIAEWRNTAAMYNALRKVTLSDEQFTALVLDAVLPIAEAKETDSKRKATSRDLTEARRDELRTLWLNGIGHSGDRSAAEALQAVTQATDWSPDIFRGRKSESWDQGSALDGGNLAAIKSKATNALLALV